MEPHADNTVSFTVPTHVLERVEADYAHYRRVLATFAHASRAERASTLRELAIARRSVARSYEALGKCFVSSSALFRVLCDAMHSFDQHATETDKAARILENLRGGDAR